MNLTLMIIFIGTVTTTSYRSVPSQTDSSPWITSIGDRVNSHGVAVSRDLLSKNGGPLNYGDEVYIEGHGFKVINDIMHKRHKRSLDIWVRTYAEEKRIGVSNKAIWLIKPKGVSSCQPATKQSGITARIVGALLGVFRKTTS